MRSREICEDDGPFLSELAPLRKVDMCGKESSKRRISIGMLLATVFCLPATLLRGQAAPTRPPSRSAMRSPTGNWRTHVSRDDRTGSLRLSIYVDAVKSVPMRNGSVTPRFSIQCRSGKLDIGLYVGVSSNHKKMELRFDDGEVLSVSVDKRTSSRWLFLSADGQRDVRDLLARLSEAHSLSARFTPDIEPSVTFAFDVRGLDPLLPRLEKAGCQPKRALIAHRDEVTERPDTVTYTPTDDQAQSQTYFEFQVEKPAIMLQGGPKPTYPSALESLGLAGDVEAQFVVRNTGQVNVDTFKVLKSTNELFTQAVRNVLPKMQFSPAMIGGKRVNQLVQQTFHFAARR